MAKESDQPVELIFIPSPEIRQVLNEIRPGAKPEGIPVRVHDLMEWLKGFKLDTIELTIQFVIKNDGIVKLFVSFGGGGGCKVILKPNNFKYDLYW